MAVTDDDMTGLSQSEANNDGGKEQRRQQQQQQQQQVLQKQDEIQKSDSKQYHDFGEDDDDFEGDELLAELLGGKHPTKSTMAQLTLEDQEEDKTWKCLDSVHSRASTFGSATGSASSEDMSARDNYFSSSGCFDDSAASFASFGDSCSSLDDSDICDIKETFQDIDDKPSRPPIQSIGGGLPSISPSPSSSSSSSSPSSSSIPTSGALMSAGRPRLGAMGRSMSARNMMKRGASFRGSLDLIKENSLH